MKKILKFIFSRLSLIFVSIIFQIAWYIFIPIFLGSKFPAVPINLIMSLLAILIVIVIINSDMKVEGQLPIIILCIISPIIGVVISIIFVSPHIPKKIKKFYEESKLQIKENMVLSEKEKENLNKSLGDNQGHFNYIYNTTGLKSYQNTTVDFFSEGEKFFKELKNELKKAERYIFMEYFIIEQGEMWDGIFEILCDKVKNGVEVRLMYDDLGTITKLPSNFAKRLKKVGINAIKFNEYSETTSAIYNNRDHRKITVIDGKVGFMGGVNIADEYINKIKPFGYFKDTAVKITGDAVKSLVCMFMQLFDIQTKTIEKFSEYINYDFSLDNKRFDSDSKRDFQINENNEECRDKLSQKLKETFLEFDLKNKNFETKQENETKNENINAVVCPFGDGPKYFDGEQVGENVLINLISQAKNYVYITTPYLIIDSNLKNALINACKKGVKVKIVTPHIPDKKIVFSITRSNYKNLIDGGVEILEYSEGFIHAKQVLVDDKLGIVGTINLDYRSLIHHYECGVLMYNCLCLKDIKKDFENIFETAINMSDYKQNYFAKLFCAVIKLFTPLL
ncbi:MAG: hypothetical protein IJX17_01735 [Clostridia bacterium]|nr:hypothetical protein [Clostridia bacterium]